jgi:Protein of unknown function (DUF2934)
VDKELVDFLGSKGEMDMRVRCEPVNNLEIESSGEVEVGSLVGTENSAPSEDRIRLRAFQIYLERGGDHGHDLDDWLQAKVEVHGHTYHGG